MSKQEIVTDVQISNQEINKNDDPRWDTYDRSTRAKVIDSRIQQGIVELSEDMAEMVVNRLYLELKNHETGKPFQSAREYFKSRQISKTQGYRLAYLGTEVMPKLIDSKLKDEMLRLGQGKLEIISKKADFDSLLANASLKIGDEEFDLLELEEMTRDDLDNRLKALSKKLEKTELLEEQKKSLELENKAILKKLDEVEARDAKYRQISETEAQIEADLNEASKAWERVQVLLYRINSIDAPTHLQTKLVDTIRTIQRGTDRISEQHAEVLIIHEDAVI